MNTLGTVCGFLAVTVGLFGVQKLFAEASARYRDTFTERAQARLSDLFVFVDLSSMWPVLFFCALCVACVNFVVTQSIVLSLLLGGAIFIAPRLMISVALKNRQSKFEAQLPFFLLSLSSSLRSGASLQSAIKNTLNDSPAPLSQEFGLVLREQRMGLGLDEALEHLYSRAPSENVELVITMLTIGMQAGGSLAGPLERLCENLRKRQHLEMKVKVLTAQGRLQAWIMGALPLVLLLVLSWLDPQSFRLLFTSTIGQGVLATIVCLELSGLVWLRRVYLIRA